MLGIAPRTVQMLDDTGRLPSERTPTGRRRFRRVDVEALAVARAQRAVGRAARALLSVHGSCPTETASWECPLCGHVWPPMGEDGL